MIERGGESRATGLRKFVDFHGGLSRVDCKLLIFPRAATLIYIARLTSSVGSQRKIEAAAIPGVEFNGTPAGNRRRTGDGRVSRSTILFRSPAGKPEPPLLNTVSKVPEISYAKIVRAGGEK